MNCFLGENRRRYFLRNKTLFSIGISTCCGRHHGHNRSFGKCWQTKRRQTMISLESIHPVGNPRTEARHQGGSSVCFTNPALSLPCLLHLQHEKPSQIGKSCCRHAANILLGEPETVTSAWASPAKNSCKVDPKRNLRNRDELSKDCQRPTEKKKKKSIGRSQTHSYFRTWRNPDRLTLWRSVTEYLTRAIATETSHSFGSSLTVDVNFPRNSTIRTCIKEQCSW